MSFNSPTKTLLEHENELVSKPKSNKLSRNEEKITQREGAHRPAEDEKRGEKTKTTAEIEFYLIGEVYFLVYFVPSAGAAPPFAGEPGEHDFSGSRRSPFAETTMQIFFRGRKM